MAGVHADTINGRGERETRLDGVSLAVVTIDPDQTERCAIITLPVEGPVRPAWLSVRRDAVIDLEAKR